MVQQSIYIKYSFTYKEIAKEIAVRLKALDNSSLLTNECLTQIIENSFEYINSLPSTSFFWSRQPLAYKDISSNSYFKLIENIVRTFIDLETYQQEPNLNLESNHTFDYKNIKISDDLEIVKEVILSISQN